MTTSNQGLNLFQMAEQIAQNIPDSEKDAKKNIKNATIIVRSSAIKNNNVEISQAKKKKITNFFKR